MTLADVEEGVDCQSVLKTPFMDAGMFERAIVRSSVKPACYSSSKTMPQMESTYALSSTMFSALAIAQTDAPATPTKESIARMQDLSYGYMRLIVRALAWKAPATKARTEMRAWVESMAQPTLPSSDCRAHDSTDFARNLSTKRGR